MIEEVFMLPNVLQVVPKMESGGVEKNVVDLFIGIEEKYKNPHSFLASAQGTLINALPQSVKHFNGPFDSKNLFTLINNAFSIGKIIDQHQINIVHARSRAPAWSCLLAKTLKKFKFITTYHATYNDHNSFKHFYNSVMVRSDRVIAISEFIKQHILLKYPFAAEKISLIPEGIDINLFDPKKIDEKESSNLRASWGISSHQKIILLPGRITFWKGQDIVLKALNNLVKDRQDIVVVFLGLVDESSQYVKNLKSYINTNGLSSYVQFQPPLSNMPLAYASSNIVISASTDPEAFGRVSAEATAMGKVVIGTNHGATPELIKPSGFLVSPKDELSLTKTIQEALEISQEEINRRASNGRNHIVKNYSLERMVKDTMSLYQEYA